MKTRTFIAAGLAVHARTITTTRHLSFRRACFWTGFLAFATMAFGPQPAQAAVTEAWVHRYSTGFGNTIDRAVKVVRDAVGDIIVTGTTGGIYGGPLLTIKYSGVDGSVRWQQRYNGPANGAGQATALAVDASGNVVVAGYSSIDLNSDHADYYIAKYAAADGALLWEKRYNGPANVGDYARALAVDGTGNVVVTGTSPEGLTRHAYSTAKYAAADNNGDNYVGRLAVGPNGMVVVTGRDPDLSRATPIFYATVVYWELLPAVSIDLIPTGVRLRFTGVPNRSYNLELAPAITGPWSTINTQIAPLSGFLEYLDTNSPAVAAFYRTREP